MPPPGPVRAGPSAGGDPFGAHDLQALGPLGLGFGRAFNVRVFVVCGVGVQSSLGCSLGMILACFGLVWVVNFNNFSPIA